VIDPALGFPAMAAALESIGFRRDPSVRPLTRDVLPGEPELAAWTIGDGAARLTYTLNPVVSLRVLAPSEVPGETLALVASRLPLLDAPAVARLLAEADPRRVLLGLFAARTLGARELAPQVEALRVHTDPLVSRAAKSTWDALDGGREGAARREALRLLQILCEQAIPVLASLAGPGGATEVEALRPRAEDFPRIFRPEIAEAARAAYEDLWRSPPRVEPLASSSVELEVVACPAGMLGEENELSRRFPGGYRSLAPLLMTDRVWFVWRYLRPGAEAGMRYDGLVRIDDRWVWLPKPYRVVGAIVKAGGG
jgi:hypothetical protein